MSKFENILLASDFDRTLTNRNGVIPQANLDAIAYFMANGGAFTVCTGRSLPMSRDCFADVPMNAPLLVCNGAVCFDRNTEQILFCHPLPEDCMALMQHYERTCPDLRLEVHCLDQHYIFHSDVHREENLRRNKTPYVRATWDMVPEPRVKFSIYSRSENVFAVELESEEGQRFLQLEAEINAWGQGRYTAVNSLPGMVEVQTAGTSKGLAARELARRMGRGVLACTGDATNDISMLDEADLAFLASDGDSRMFGRGYRLAAPCDAGTVADVIRQLDEMFA